jgi:hypothetical protein
MNELTSYSCATVTPNVPQRDSDVTILIAMFRLANST